MKPEIRYDMTREEYDAHPAINFSRLKMLRKSPAHFLAAKNKDTDARVFGRCGHLAILEPEKFKTEVAVWNDGDKRKAAAKWKEFKAKAETHSLEVLDAEDYERCKGAAAAVRDNPLVAPLFARGRPEVSIFFYVEIAPRSFVQVKCRLDWVPEEGPLLDVKLTRCAEPRVFFKQAHDLGIHIQAAIYSHAFLAASGDDRGFRIVAAENEAPFVVTVFDIPEVLIRAGWAEALDLLRLYDACKTTGRWPGYSEEPVWLEFPPYASMPDLSNETHTEEMPL